MTTIYFNPNTKIILNPRSNVTIAGGAQVVLPLPPKFEGPSKIVTLSDGTTIVRDLNEIRVNGPKGKTGYVNSLPAYTVGCHGRTQYRSPEGSYEWLPDGTTTTPSTNNNNNDFLKKPIQQRQQRKESTIKQPTDNYSLLRRPQQQQEEDVEQKEEDYVGEESGELDYTESTPQPEEVSIPKPTTEFEEFPRLGNKSIKHKGLTVKLGYDLSFFGNDPVYNERTLELDNGILKWNSGSKGQVALGSWCFAKRAEPQTYKLNVAHPGSYRKFCRNNEHHIAERADKRVNKTYGIQLHVDPNNCQPGDTNLCCEKKEIAYYFFFCNAHQRDTWLEKINSLLPPIHPEQRFEHPAIIAQKARLAEARAFQDEKRKERLQKMSNAMAHPHLLARIIADSKLQKDSLLRAAYISSATKLSNALKVAECQVMNLIDFDRLLDTLYEGAIIPPINNNNNTSEQTTLI
ncbi:hypothetical protein DFA_03964 [Cavenderia fasciculata]|uniref:Uncharacterized protein n=1 Tax=Cavenderia fasciculata TaxID=261658 RepID=F4Q0W9_CACFS|nr:uncharacterized protein DFA_03964 [Cavenderia fasciculata]EGG18470.1 hypothetical protein DFA_03964 [Cavenderia fasciculata]|eukprot:XP_004366374.1 hypothetical protein DFA_03964 [Cavenderia fasciculata]